MKGYYQYAADVRDGRALVGEFIKQAVERFYTLFERDDIEFREERADYAIEFIALLRHYTGRPCWKIFCAFTVAGVRSGKHIRFLQEG